MTADALFQPFLVFTRIFGSPPTRKQSKKGALPTWNRDSHFSLQLMKDSGISPEDLGCSPGWDEKLPFFMQNRQW